MTNRSKSLILIVILATIVPSLAQAQEKPVVSLIRKAQANRGGLFLYLWDEKNLYIGPRCLDKKPAHIDTDNQIWNGDAVEFYLDTRRGDKLARCPFPLPHHPNS